MRLGLGRLAPEAPGTENAGASALKPVDQLSDEGQRALGVVLDSLVKRAQAGRVMAEGQCQGIPRPRSSLTAPFTSCK